MPELTYTQLFWTGILAVLGLAGVITRLRGRVWNDFTLFACIAVLIFMFLWFLVYGI